MTSSTVIRIAARELYREAEFNVPVEPDPVNRDNPLLEEAFAAPAESTGWDGDC